MRAVSICSFLTLFVAAGLQAQNQSEVMYDNDQVRVVKTTLQPHQSIPLRDYPLNRVLICLDSGQGARTFPNGKLQHAACKTGDVAWSPGGLSYASENTFDEPFQVIEIELKNKLQPQATFTDLDPLKADPNHYQLVFENDHVRVLRVRFGPLEKGVVHEHLRNYLVVYMTPQAKGDRGEVRLHFDEGTTKHTENNPLNQAVERIAVELKQP